MERYVIEEQKINKTDGRFVIVQEGRENVLNRVMITANDILFYTTQSGYDYNHPYERAKQNAQAIANGLNALEREKEKQRKRIVDKVPEF